jgi:AcrR family transcriptional regulator
MDTREKIIETAMRLFATKGYGNTSLAQVAKEAQVSKALILWHFESKDGLFRTAVQRTFEPYIINVAHHLRGLSEIDQITRLVDDYYAFVSKHVYSVKFFLGLLLDADQRSHDLVTQLEGLQGMFRSLLVGIIETGRQKGILREGVHPERDAGLIVNALHGILVQGFLTPGSDRVLDDLSHLKAALVEGLTARPASGPGTAT